MLRNQLLYLAVTASFGLAACAGESGGAAVPQADGVRVADETRPVAPEAPHGAGELPAAPAAEAAQPMPGSLGGSGTPAGDAATPAASAPAPGPASPQGSPAASQAVPPAPAATDAEAILRRAETAYDAIRTLQANFVQDLSVPLLNSTQRSRGELFVRKPDRFLMRFSDPAGDVVVTDGTHLWMYYPSTDPRQVVRTSAGEGGQQLDLQREFLSNPTARYRAVLNGTESVGGRTAHVLTLTPRTASPYERVRIWVDAQDHLVRRFEIIETNESVRRLELSNLRPNAALSDQLFRFTPPAGAQVFDQ
jgi:outer membrane lipoprotein carrier protein